MLDFRMEISGLDPETTICKIVVLPIKLYPLSDNHTLFCSDGFVSKL